MASVTLPGTYEDARFRAPLLHGYPSNITARLESRYTEIANAPRDTRVPGELSGVGKANRWLVRTEATLRAAKSYLAFNEQELRECATLFADRCAKLSKTSTVTYLASHGITLTPKALSQPGWHWKTRSAIWWRSQLRKRWLRASEDAMRRGQFIHRLADPICSTDSLLCFRASKRRTQEFLQCSALIELTTGEILKLAEVASRSLSNPAVRRAEFMVRIKGLELCAMRRGDCGRFFTLTTPSAFHAMNHDGRANPRYQGFDVRQAQAWQCRMWSRARSKLKRLGVLAYGFRVCEAHHDGTPHWHMLLFCPQSQADTLAKVLRHYWLSEYSDEPGAEAHRFKTVDIDFQRKGKDGRRSGAVGYIAKYISKSIDGTGVGDGDPEEQTGLDGITEAERMVCWATRYGIRQFQQIGGPAVTLWREFRRLDKPLADEASERIRAAADAGDYAAFIEALGGIEVGRSHLFRVLTQQHTEPGFKQLNAERTKADLPPRHPRITGIQAVLPEGNVFIQTRCQRWERVCLGSVYSPWTRGTNCTITTSHASEKRCATADHAPGDLGPPLLH